MPKFFSINDAMDDAGSERIEEFVRDTLLAIYPTQSEFESGLYSLASEGQALPDTSKTATCPSELGRPEHKGGWYCPASHPSHSHTPAICTHAQGEAAAACEYTVDGR